MKNSKIFLFISILFLCTGCPDQDKFDPNREIRIVNSSDMDLVELRTERLLSDTLLPISSPFTDQIFIEFATIKSGSSILIPVESETVREYGLTLFLLSYDTLLSVPWEQIRENNLIEMRYDLTLEDLEDMDWTIIYP
ncbi:hypothetical protein [Penaeicola halotolerans]|uniref:hypothetical protein n=1 Tax=Penaeicola halotolerans TaxID=2793196 RepID=UPI001CF89076|nr:hypothetical protein [Penaeicola halotolerans]